mgnify:CR=1 FL=1
MKKIKLLLWSAVVATLSACSSSSPEALEGSWQLTHIDGKPAATGAVLQLNLKDKKVKAYRITQKQLVLLDAQGQELLTFKKE